MKLKATECRDIRNAILRQYLDATDEIEKRTWSELRNKFEGPEGRILKQEVEFEEAWRNQLAELREKEAEVDEKIRKLQNYYLAFSKKSWQFIFGMIQVVLIFSLLGAVLYTIASTPSELAVWAPIPIAFCLFLCEYSGKYFTGWFWRKKK